MTSQDRSYTVDRKIAIIIKEWDHIQSLIRHEISLKAQIRGFSITSFSAICAVSFHQQNNLIPLAIIPISLIFWYMDFTRQAIQNIVIQISIRIEKALENPNDKSILDIKSPTYTRELADIGKLNEYRKSAMFGKWRVSYYGSMIFGAIILYFII